MSNFLKQAYAQGYEWKDPFQHQQVFKDRNFSSVGGIQDNSVLVTTLISNNCPKVNFDADCFNFPNISEVQNTE